MYIGNSTHSARADDVPALHLSPRGRMQEASSYFQRIDTYWYLGLVHTSFVLRRKRPEPLAGHCAAILGASTSLPLITTFRSYVLSGRLLSLRGNCSATVPGSRARGGRRG